MQIVPHVVVLCRYNLHTRKGVSGGSTAQVLPTRRGALLRTLRQIRKRERVRVQVVLNIPSLEPRLANRPLARAHCRRAEDVRGADLSIRGPVQDVGGRVDVVYGAARREHEAETRGLARAVVCTLQEAT